MKLTKAEVRDKKIFRRKYGHKTDGKSIFIIQKNEYIRAKKRKAVALKRNRNRKFKEKRMKNDELDTLD